MRRSRRRSLWQLQVVRLASEPACVRISSKPVDLPEDDPQAPYVCEPAVSVSFFICIPPEDGNETKHSRLLIGLKDSQGSKVDGKS